MGKTQSKRSVDITTDGKKTPEGSPGKLEKIEDVDQHKQGNGDASQECKDSEEKVEVEDSETEKDMTTEKNGEPDQNKEQNNTERNNSMNSGNSKENIAEGKDNSAEDISPLSDESIKKSKKEKVKKKWSFRSISFGKKDKQKPSKSEETTDEIIKNGETEKTAVVDCDASKESEEIAVDANNKKYEDESVIAENEHKDEVMEKSLNAEKTADALTETVAPISKNVAENANEISSITTEKQTDDDNKQESIAVEAVEIAATAAAAINLNSTSAPATATATASAPASVPASVPASAPAPAPAPASASAAAPTPIPTPISIPVPISVPAVNINAEANQNGNKISDETVDTPTEHVTPSQCISEVITSKAVTNEIVGCDAEKPQENGTIEEHINSHIEDLTKEEKTPEITSQELTVVCD